MKKLFIAVIILGLSASLFAQQGDHRYGGMYDKMKDLIESKETVALQGALVTENRIFPELNAGDKVYRLILPRYCFNDLDISDNELVSVEGVILKVKEGVQTRFLKAGDEVLYVTKITINGEVFTFDDTQSQCQGPRWDKGKGRMGGNFRGHRGPGGDDSPPDLFE